MNSLCGYASVSVRVQEIADKNQNVIPVHRFIRHFHSKLHYTASLLDVNINRSTWKASFSLINKQRGTVLQARSEPNSKPARVFERLWQFVLVYQTGLGFTKDRATPIKIKRKHIKFPLSQSQSLSLSLHDGCSSESLLGKQAEADREGIT